MHALDYIHTLTDRRCEERHTLPLPAIPDGWVRILASDHPDIVAEYERRKAALNLPVPAATYSVSDYTTAVQAALDAAAQAKHYDDIVSACSYAAAPNVFQAEAIAFVQWRSAMWAACYAAQANPPAVQPTPEEFVAALLAQYPAP